MAGGLWDSGVPARVAWKPARASARGAGASSAVLRWSCYAAVVAGIVLRLLQLLANRGLSQDEAQLALNVMDRSLRELMGQLDYQQAAPEGFLAIQKLAVWIFGSSEYALRLFPFIAGSAAVVVLVTVARNVLQPLAVPFAIALFAFSDPLINWSVYDKQYAVDVLFAVVLLALGCRLLDHPPQLRTLLAFAAVGVVAIWMSHSSVFVLAGVATALFLSSLLQRDWRYAGVVAATAVPWVASFGVFLATSGHNLVLLQKVLRGSPGAFAVSGGSGFESFRKGFGEFRYASGVSHFLTHGGVDAGLLVLLVAAVFCVVGSAAILRRQPMKALALVTPLGFMLIAWAINKYPLLGRTQLFLVPSFVLLAAEGAAFAIVRARSNSLRVASVVAGASVVVAIAAPSLGHIANPRKLQDMKPVLNDVARNQRAGDTVFVYYSAQYQLRYYLECGCAGAAFTHARAAGWWPLRPGPAGPEAFAPALRSVPPRFLVPPFRGRDPTDYVADIDALKGSSRVWLIVSAVDAPDTATLLKELDRRARRRGAFTVGEGLDAAGAYLYDLSRRG